MHTTRDNTSRCRGLIIIIVLSLAKRVVFTLHARSLYIDGRISRSVIFLLNLLLRFWPLNFSLGQRIQIPSILKHQSEVLLIIDRWSDISVILEPFLPVQSRFPGGCAYGSLQSLRLLSPRPWRWSPFNSKKLYSLFPPLCSFPSSPHSPLVDVSSTWSWLSPSVAPTKAHFSRSLPPASPLIQWLRVLRPRAP